MNDDLDRRLTEAGARWRETEPEPRRLDPSLLTEPRVPRAPRWVVPLAAAAAVVAVVAGTAMLLDDDGEGRGGVHPATTTPDPLAGVVPWKAIDPRDLVMYPHEEVWVPDPAQADGLATCTDDDVVATSRRQDLGGTVQLTVRFAARAGVECSLEGEIGVTMLDEGGPIDVETRPLEVGDGAWPFATYVGGDQAATVRLFWATDWCGEPVVNERIGLTWADHRVEVDGFGASPTCEGTRRANPGAVDVGPIEPAQWELRDGPPRLAPIEARPVDVVVDGSTATYVVELVAPTRDVRLDPCPDAEVVRRWSHEDQDEHEYGLNCDAVPHRDAEGVPYLPQGVPVRFAVEVPVPDGDLAPESTWVLHAPEPVRVPLPPLPPEDPIDSDLLVDEEDASVVLVVGNASSTPYVDFRVVVDGALVAADRAWNGASGSGRVTPAPTVSLPLALPPGQQSVRVEAGNQVGTWEVDVPETGTTYVLARFVGAEPGIAAPEPWHWSEQDRPFEFR